MAERVATFGEKVTEESVDRIAGKWWRVGMMDIVFVDLKVSAEVENF